MSYEYIGDPCRNFCILASTVIMDPKDGREKIIFSSFVSGGTGRLIFVDTQSEEGESIELPGDEGAWALFCLENGKLLVGTCGLKGYLHCLDLKSRTWAEPLRDEHETYIWNLAEGSDGMIYGGTWPDCVLLRYDPEKHVLENMGRMSQYEGNQYSRQVYGNLPGRILVNCGYQKPHIAVWDMKTYTVCTFGREGAAIKEINKELICTITGDELDFYDPATLEPAAASLPVDRAGSLQFDNQTPVSRFLKKLARSNRDKRLLDGMENELALSNGDIAGVKGQEFFILRKQDTGLKLKRIPVEAPPTQILTITSAPDGKLWGSSNFGQTIFCYNTGDGTYWNSPAVCNRGGEIYGMRIINGKVFMAAYAGGDHVVYNPSEPWDQVNNVNPVTLKQAGPDLVRPHGKSAIGPDGAFWTGWTAKYGTYGGGLTRVDTGTYEVASWYDPIPGQSIESLASGDRYLYFTTCGLANGLPEKSEPFHMVAWDPKGEIVWQRQFPKDTRLGLIEIVGGYGLVNIGDEIKVFRCSNMEFLSSIKLEEPCTCMLKYNDDTAAVFAGRQLFFIEAAAGRACFAAELPGTVKTAAVDDKGVLYFAQLSHLYKLG